ncbi:flagellar protein FliT [Noviherbaspirillum galbum]|uniref:Flagellar protein FliT n=1 Tax=Noviherbaspirillum galbum TaxID=2709383 RepID=A0A6B3SPM6_9BURK|nr:flagellar protein FliT [Noviherbaspirillum galbum]NEX62703.1 flagellar protein FliT [Noviherbaspirillum galbum]
MDSQEILAVYETIADITDQMVAAARTGNWEQLAALESRCSHQVDIIRQNDDAPGALSEIAREKKVSIIKKILADDREIRSITEPWMSKLAELMNSAGTERKLSKAYGANQTG